MVQGGRLSCVIAVTLVISACGRADPSGPARQALRDARLEHLNVAWDGRIVHLQGEVGTAEDRERAEMVIRNAVGTSGRVQNEINVRTAVDNVSEAVDERIRVAVRETIKSHPTLSARPIVVRVTGASVLIEGRVQSVEEWELVTQRVRAVAGVRELTNALEIDEAQP